MVISKKSAFKKRLEAKRAARGAKAAVAKIDKPTKTKLDKPAKATRPTKIAKTWDSTNGTPSYEPAPRKVQRPKTTLRTMKEVRFALGPGNYRKIARDTGYAAQHITRVLKKQSGVSLECACDIADSARVTLDQLRDFLEEVEAGKNVDVGGESGMTPNQHAMEAAAEVL